MIAVGIFNSIGRVGGSNPFLLFCCFHYVTGGVNLDQNITILFPIHSSVYDTALVSASNQEKLIHCHKE